METFLSLLLHPLSTCLIGILGGGLITYIVARWQMKNIIILHKVIGPIDIGSGLTSLFPDVQLTYKGEIINYTIQYIIGTIKNDDKTKDLSTQELPIQLFLPQNSEILEAKLLDSRIEKLDIEYNKNNIVFNMPKSFLHQEEFRYCVLFKCPDEDYIEESDICLNTRIPNVSFSNGEKEEGFIYEARIHVKIIFFISLTLTCFSFIPGFFEDEVYAILARKLFIIILISSCIFYIILFVLIKNQRIKNTIRIL